jgi:DNA-binding transcriptional regulator GbsR (MarR family)
MASELRVERFIESWGTLGALWGINRSIARIQALLLVSSEPLQLDQIADRLAISRGNVSMSLKELCSWGVVHRANQHGDRRDYFSAETDSWTMLFKIARERKKREFDPAISSLREILETADILAPSVRTRLVELERILATVDRVMQVILSDEHKGKQLFGFFSDLLLRAPS